MRTLRTDAHKVIRKTKGTHTYATHFWSIRVRLGVERNEEGREGVALLWGNAFYASIPIFPKKL